MLGCASSGWRSRVAGGLAIMGDWLDQVARAMARGASRKDFLKVVGAGLLGLVVGEASVAEAKKGGKGGKGGKKGDKNPCPTGLTKCPDGTCHDLTSDPSNCFVCDTPSTEIDDICAN